MKIRNGNHLQLYQVRLGIRLLKQAREAFKVASCPKTLQRVRLALTSGGGAERHMEHRIRRAQADVAKEAK